MQKIPKVILHQFRIKTPVYLYNKKNKRMQINITKILYLIQIEYLNLLNDYNSNQINRLSNDE